MTLFTLGKDGKFAEFNDKKKKSDPKELDLFSLIEKNPDSLFQDEKLMIIGKNVTTEHGDIIDLLAVDKKGQIVVVDIQGKKASRKGLTSLIEKAAYVDTFDFYDLNATYKDHDRDASKLSKAHAAFFETDIDKSFWNKHLKLVIVAQKINPELQQAATYLRRNGLDLACILFNFHSDDNDMISREYAVGGEPFKARSTPEEAENDKTPKTDKELFFMALDENGEKVFSRIVDFAEKEDLVFKWTPQGFSLNVMLNDKAVGLCYGYALDSLLNQSIYTGFDQLQKLVNKSDEIISHFITRIEELGLFNRTRSSYRWNIADDQSDTEIQEFCDILKEIVDKIRENGLISITADTPLV